MRFFFLFLFAFGTVAVSWSSSNVTDSLFRIVRFSKNDSLRLDANNKLIWKVLFSNSEKAKKLIDYSSKLAKLPNTSFGATDLLTIKGVFFDLNNQSDSAHFYFYKALESAKKYHFKIQENHALTNLGMFHWNRGNYYYALDFFFRSIRQSKTINDARFKDQSSNWSNIGLIYQEMKLYQKALHYHNKALFLRRKKKDVSGIIISLNNKGICLTNLNQLKNAESCFLEGSRLASENLDMVNKLKIIHGIGMLRIKHNQSEQAIPLFKESLERDSKIPYSNLDRLSDLTALANCYVLQKKADSALFYCEQALVFQKLNFNNKVVFPELLLFKSQAFYLQNEFEKAKLYSDSFQLIIEEKFNDKNTRYLHDLEFQSQLSLKKEIVNSREKKLSQKNNRLLILLLIIVLVLFIVVLLYILNSLKSKRLIVKQELERELILLQNELKLKEQKEDFSRDLHDNIGSQMTFVSYTITELMEQSKHDNQLNKGLKDVKSFVTQVLQDLRDTIWVMNQTSISSSELQERMLRYIEQLNQFSENFVVFFESEFDEAEELMFTDQESIHLLGILKESLNNTIKHAQSKQCNVSLTAKGKKVELMVKDDGIGFNNQAEKVGYGLYNMEKRAQLLNGELVIISNSNGTQILFSYFQKNEVI